MGTLLSLLIALHVLLFAPWPVRHISWDSDSDPTRMVTLLGLLPSYQLVVFAP